MSVLIPVSTLVRLVLWLAAIGVVAGFLIGARATADTSTSPGPAPTTVVRPAADHPAVEAAARGGR
ncbi:MAG TPA: hypothetical protein VGP26_10580 [Actinophytocola sp.]|jgi:hypothetical protein|nr:hypothetical protein [Actinophytocola sp.]